MTSRRHAAPGTPKPEARLGRPTPPRRGMVLVFFALLSFVVMGFVALTVDLGLARLTQRQMQSATDAMALEVLRERDLARVEEAEENPWFRDKGRRVRNARIGSWQYMPLMETAGDVYDDSAGPGVYVNLQGGIGPMNASQLITGGGYSVPRPRLNYEPGPGSQEGALNRQEGDLVSGSFTGHLDQDQDGLADGAIGFQGNPMWVESSKYDRVDFVPAEPLNAAYGDSVVARLRRTLAPYAMDTATTSGYDNLANISSSGPTLPFLFGLGTTMYGGAPSGGYSPRFDGIAVRATSVAQARPAVRVGPPVGQYDLGATVDGYGVGCAPFVLLKSTWQESPFLVWQQDGEGNEYIELTYTDGFLAPPSDDDQLAALLQPPRLHRIGDRVYRLQDAAGLSFWTNPKNWEVEEAYAPVIRYKPLTGQPWSGRIVGFVRVRAESVELEAPGGGGLPGSGGAAGGPGGADPEQLRMRLWRLGNERVRPAPATPWVAPRNASALFDGLEVSAEEMESDVFLGRQVWSWQYLMAELYGGVDPYTGNPIRALERPVMAPALVR